MQTFEIGHLGGIARFHESFITSLDQGGQSATEHGLLTEQVGLCLFPKIGFNHPGTPTADGARVSQADLLGRATWVLMHGQETGHAASLRIFRSYQMAGPFRS